MSDVDRDLIFNTPAERMWETAIRRLGADPADAADDARGVHVLGARPQCQALEL